MKAPGGWQSLRASPTEVLPPHVQGRSPSAWNPAGPRSWLGGQYGAKRPLTIFRTKNYLKFSPKLAGKKIQERSTGRSLNGITAAKLSLL